MRSPHALHDPPSVIVDETAAMDFAFADTVVATDFDEAVSASGLTSGLPFDGRAGHAHCLTPRPYPYLTAHRADAGSGLTAKLRDAWARMRERMSASRAEMSELWSATACLEHVHDGRGAIIYEEDPLARAATVGRRVRTFFSFFEWDRADMLRAAWIGLLVFVLVATAGAFALERGAHAGVQPVAGVPESTTNVVAR